MSWETFSIVICAAFLHAFWNAVAKKNADKQGGVQAVVLGHVPFGLLALCFVDLPSLETLPYILIGALLHTGYQFSLLTAYRHGDLSSVYPISRGFAPVLAALALYLIWDEALSQLQIMALLTICAGVLSFVFVAQGTNKLNATGLKASLFTALFIASYSIIDGIGARLAQNPLGFYACLTLFNAVFFCSLAVCHAPHNPLGVVRQNRLAFFGGGAASFIAYALVTYAFTQAPIALVAALREVSIIFALIIGAVFLKERIYIQKIISTTITLCGVVMLRLSR